MAGVQGFRTRICAKVYFFAEFITGAKPSRRGREGVVHREAQGIKTKQRNYVPLFCFYGWGAGIRTPEMSESESDALPLGDTPIFGFILTTRTLYQKFFGLSIAF